MTVNELIEVLNKVNDKTRVVVLPIDVEGTSVALLEEIESNYFFVPDYEPQKGYISHARDEANAKECICLLPKE